MEEESKQWERNGRRNENGMECGKCKWKLNPYVMYCGEVEKRKRKLTYYCLFDTSKAAWYNGCHAGRVD